MLRLSDVFANVIVDGQIDLDGEFFRTQRADIHSVRNLRIRVESTATYDTIVSANPPADNPYVTGMQPYRDVLENTTTNLTPEGIGDANTPAEGSVTYSTISVMFSGTPSTAFSPTTTFPTVTCNYSGIPAGGSCPSVTDVTGSGVGPYVLTLSAPILPGGCTSIQFPNSCEVLHYQSLPGDVNYNGTLTGQDVIALVAAINNNTANSSLDRYDINRNGQVTGQDVTRLVQLYNGGITVTQAWGGVSVLDCPPDPICGQPGGGNAPTGAGGESEGGGGEGPLTSEQIALITAAIQAGCAELDLDSTACQALIDSILPPP